MSNLYSIIDRQREFFYSGYTKTETFRKENLEKLRDLVDLYEDEILACLKVDLGKSNFEAYVSEISFLKEEIKFALDNALEVIETGDSENRVN